MSKNLSALGGRAVLMIYKDGQVIFNDAYNSLSAKQKIGARIIARRSGKDAQQLLKDYDADTQIAIASCSKWLTAALVMTFVDEGKLQLQDTLGSYLPVMTANGKGNITIEQCLSHTTGIAANQEEEIRFLTQEATSMSDAVLHFARQPMEAAPGTAFHYSSVGLQLAAAVLEKISGQDFETLFRDRIAKPCGMVQTNFGYKKVPFAAGGAQSTASDYLRFLEMILHKGAVAGKQILSQKSISAMQVDYTKGKKIVYSPAEAGNWGYGLGEWVVSGSSRADSTGSVTSPGMFGSFPWVNNELQYAAVLFTFNLKSQGRHDRYLQLKQTVDEILR